MEFNAEKIEKAKALYEFIYDYCNIGSQVFDAKYPDYTIFRITGMDVSVYIQMKYF